MNEKLRRAIAIIALILVAVFTVSLILYLFDATMLNGALGDLAIWTGAFALLLCAVLWLTHSFPSQQVKDAERERLYEEAEREAEKEGEKDGEEGDKSSDEAEEEADGTAETSEELAEGDPDEEAEIASDETAGRSDE